MRPAARPASSSAATTLTASKRRVRAACCAEGYVCCCVCCASACCAARYVYECLTLCAANVEHIVKQIEFFNGKTVVHYAASEHMHAAVVRAISTLRFYSFFSLLCTQLEDGSVYTWGSATFALGHGERVRCLTRYMHHKFPV